MSERFLQSIVAALVFGMASVLPATPSSAEDKPLVPHHAMYKLTLAKADGRKAPADASGYIKYQFSGSACAGYTTTFEQLTSLAPPEGESRVSESHSTTIESGDAKQFRFDTHSKLNGNDDEMVVGQAVKTATGLSVGLEQPNPEAVTVQAPALFPTEHLQRIIATGKAGGKILSVPVFDGSGSGKKIYSTLSIIGSAVTAPPTGTAMMPDEMKAMARWPVTISFFEDQTNDAQPVYVLSFDLYENGVSRALKIDYGDFALAGELVELKLDPTLACPD